MFKIYESGFRLDLDNGYTVSVQFSPFNMCSNRQHEKEYKEQLLNKRIDGFTECSNAETAVIDTATGNFIAIPKRIIDPDTNKEITITEAVQGYQSVYNFIHLIKEIKDYPNTDSKMAEIKERQRTT